MLKDLNEVKTNLSPPRENDLYKIVELHGRTFEIRYGYYEDIDRKYDPVPIYPDFIANPVLTDDGYPFITYMQDGCEHYEREAQGDEPDCYTCIHMERGDELIGVCRCKARKHN